MSALQITVTSEMATVFFAYLVAGFTSLVLWSALHPSKTKYFNSKQSTYLLIVI